MPENFDEKLYALLLQKYLPRVIGTEEEYKRAVATVSELHLNDERTPEENALFKLLFQIVSRFEEEGYPMDTVTPNEVLQCILESKGLAQNALEPMVNSAELVSEIVNGEREIDESLANKLGAFLGVPPSLFLRVQAHTEGSDDTKTYAEISKLSDEDFDPKFVYVRISTMINQEILDSLRRMAAAKNTSLEKLINEILRRFVVDTTASGG